jgi:hypothetical protein
MSGATLALVMWVLAGKPATPDVLKGCEVFGPAFGMDRLIRCKTFQIEVYPPMPLAVEKVTLAEQARIASMGSDAKEILSMSDVKVGTKTRRAFRYLRRRWDNSRDVGLFSTVPVGTNSFRLVHCWQGMESGCLEVFALVMHALPDPTGAPPPAAPAFAGRELGVPRGCARKGPNQVSCSGGELLWTPLYEGAPESFDEIEPMIRRGTSHLGTMTAADRYCQLDKADALCRVATITGKDGGKSYLVHAFATVRDQRVWAACSTHTAPGNTLPNPCSLVMAFKPPNE